MILIDWLANYEPLKRQSADTITAFIADHKILSNDVSFMKIEE